MDLKVSTSFFDKKQRHLKLVLVIPGVSYPSYKNYSLPLLVLGLRLCYVILQQNLPILCCSQSFSLLMKKDLNISSNTILTFSYKKTDFHIYMEDVKNCITGYFSFFHQQDIEINDFSASGMIISLFIETGRIKKLFSESYNEDRIFKMLFRPKAHQGSSINDVTQKNIFFSENTFTSYINCVFKFF